MEINQRHVQVFSPRATCGGERRKGGWGNPKPRQGLPPLNPAQNNLHIGLSNYCGFCPTPGAMMKGDDQNRYQRTPAASLTVGTGGRVERMRGPCACPPGDATLVPHLLMNRLASRTGTRPPPIPSSTPCPYRTSTGAWPILSVNVHHRATTPTQMPWYFVEPHKCRGA